MFEFLNIVKTHGFPRVMGVLTHLDRFRKQSQVQKIKKKIKQRFWTEVVDGARVFYLSGLLGRRYPKREILNLARFINVMKLRPLTWRNTHPYILVDRVEDTTAPALIEADPLCDRSVSL